MRIFLSKWPLKITPTLLSTVTTSLQQEPANFVSIPAKQESCAAVRTVHIIVKAMFVGSGIVPDMKAPKRKTAIQRALDVEEKKLKLIEQ